MNKKVSPKTFSRYVAIQALYNSNYQSDYEKIKDYFLDASDWNLKRLPTVLLSILRVAVTEMIVSKNTSIGIIASEYIMFTESFYTEKEYLFTNAILEKIYSNLQKKNT